MARDLIKFSNDKKGFRMLLAVELLVAAWAVAASVSAIRRGSTSTVLYSAVTVAAIFYILGRSLRSYRNIVKKEKKEAAAGKKEKETE